MRLLQSPPLCSVPKKHRESTEATRGKKGRTAAMSLASQANPSSLLLPRTRPTSTNLQSPGCVSLPRHPSTARAAATTFLDQHLKLAFSDADLPRRAGFVARASSSAKTEPQPSNPEGGEEQQQPEVYEVEVLKPYGLKFAKGRDGGTYIEAIAPGSSADNTGKFTVGDKVLATSAVFGEEIWPAAGYGQTMYSIRQRVGPLYMKMEKRYGKWDGATELSEREIIRAERNSGVISNKVREIQIQNYTRKIEQKRNREEDLREGLKLYKNAKYEEALEKFESVLGSKPGIDEASVASYNVACCYSKLNRVQAGLSALEDALKAGYEDFKTIRTDPDLANLRSTEEFETLLKKFDESFINENAINAIKSLFGFNKK